MLLLTNSGAETMDRPDRYPLLTSILKVEIFVSEVRSIVLLRAKTL